MFLGPEERLIHLGGVPEGAGRRSEDLAEALRSTGPERGAELIEEDLEVVADVALERGEDLVDLHRDRGLGDRERVAVLRLGGVRRPRPEVDEQVSLQE